MEVKVTIGLEIHAQLLTHSKLFCSCPVTYDAPPNTAVCPVCLGMPGTLPVLNQRAVEFAVKAALALNCKVEKTSIFARKNYFYPDLPKGYQITQYDKPLAHSGYLEVNGKKIRIRRLHLEEESGKLIHTGNEVLIDFNRCGIPLIEIVTEPDISSPEEAVLFMEKLRRILRYIGVCGGDMEKGQIRCEPNLSIEVNGKVSPRREIKNLNSLRAVERALKYEIENLKNAILKGIELHQATLGWDERLSKTFEMREKETSADYRYFPEPDLPPLVISEKLIEKIKKEIPELPDVRKERMIKEYQIDVKTAEILVEEKEIADYFEETAKNFKDFRMLSNFIITEVLRILNEKKIKICDLKTKPSDLAKLLKNVKDGKINLLSAKRIFMDIEEKGIALEDILKEKEKITDEAEIEKILREIIENSPEQVKKYKSGKKGVIGYFIGELMRKTKGRADPKIANKILIKLLE